MPASREFFNGIEEVHFRLPEAVNDRFAWVLRKLSIANDKLVQIVAQEICACMTAMTIEDGEERAFGPPVALLLRWLLHVEHDGHPVLIVVSNDALVGVRCVGLNHPILFHRILG